MGFRIPCPNCGPRSYHEFAFGGELLDYGDAADPDVNFAQVWFRANRAGPQRERWYHAAGCRRWLTLERDTRTNEVLGVVDTAGPAPPDVPAAGAEI